MRILSVRPLNGMVVDVGLTDGSTRVVDFSPYLRGPVFDPLRRDPALSRVLRVDPSLGTIVWPNGADLDPDVLVLGLPPA